MAQQMPLHIAAALGRETVDLVRSGGYVAPSGRKVDLRSLLEAARHGTVEYPPEKLLPARPAAGVPGAMSVENLEQRLDRNEPAGVAGRC